MPQPRRTGATLVWLSVAMITQALSQEPDTSGQWDLATLEQPPAHRWIDREKGIHSLIYAGESYQGRKTEVFAYYASPATIDASAGKPAAGSYPAVVLIHGGGGTAFSEWVWLWARRGYAAIAMDLSGRRPPEPIYDPATGAFVRDPGNDAKTRTRLEKGGPEQGHGEKFGSIGGDHTDDWPWHAVASVVRAHSLIRSFPEIDPERTAVTGISWGGYTTCLVASVDGRFKAAVPVYGCGFLHEGESVQKPSIDALDPARRAEWVGRYDPSNHLGRCRVPILFVNGTHDIHYPLDSYQKSYALVPGEKAIRIEPKMPHGHGPGWKPGEIGLFIDSHCRGGKPLPRLGAPEILEDGTIRTTVQAMEPIKSATLHFTTERGLRSKREWQSLPATVAGESITAPALPAGTNTWFLTVTDGRGAMVSTEVRFSAADPRP
jgi:dienelactone hydrolase